MHLLLPHPLRHGLAAALLAVAGTSVPAAAEVSYYKCSDLGYLSSAYNTKAGVIATANRGSEIFLVRDNTLQTIVASPGAGMYINVSKDGRYIGYKSIDGNANQAPAVYDVTTGAVTLLEPYSNQCGQVSFADDGTMAYTVGETLILRKDNTRQTFPLGFYTNIANISPDGSKVVFNNLDGEMFVLDVEGRDISPLGAANSYRAIWSEDGAHLAIQQADGGLKSMDLASRRIYDLGRANSVRWAGTDLIITRSVSENELVVTGASVIRMDYTGANAVELVPVTEDTPVDAFVDGKELTVSYANGSNRGLTRTTYSGTMRRGAPARVSTLFKVPGADMRIGGKVNSDFGHPRPDYSKMSEEAIQVLEMNMDGMGGPNDPMRRAPKRRAGSIGLTAIPYINQVWDTPACGGSPYAYGYVCCAPSSSCMALGYYGKLTPHAVTSRSSYAANKTCYYSWYVSKNYTSVTGYNFTQTTTSGGSWGYSTGVGGGYAYMWENGSPATYMRHFHTNNGVSQSAYDYSSATMRTNVNANRPHIICLNNGTGGHVVCAFRVDQIAYNDGSGTYDKYGSFVCHDPYGDYNGSSYPNWDGRYSSYDLPGYNNGRANIGNYYWGCSVVATGNPPVTNPTITANPTDVKFKCQLNETPTATVTVTGKDLTSDIRVASSHSWRFEVSPTTLPKTGGTITIKMAHSEKAGTYQQGGTALDGQFFIKLVSGSTSASVGITAEVTAPLLSGVTEKYQYSTSKGNSDTQGYDFAKIRNFCYNAGKLYCVYENSRILVLNAQTGAKLGFLNNGDVVTSSSAKLADVKCIDGVIVASNIATASKGEKLRLYAWENDNAAPYLLFETDDFQGAPRVGDCLEMTGTFKTDCWFAFANDDTTTTRIIEYNRKDGAWLAKNTQVLGTNGSRYATDATVRAYPKGTGWWIDGKNSQPAWVTWDESKKAAVVQCMCNVGTQMRGSSHHEFYWKGQKYAVNLTYDNADGDNGRMRIIQDNVGNFSSTTLIGSYPAAGLGAGKINGVSVNANGTGDCMINTDGDTYLEAWVLSTGQGLAYYTVGNPPAQNPDPITGTEVTEKPELSVSPSSLSFDVKAGETAVQTFAVTAANLRANATVKLEGPDAANFDVSPATLSASGTVTVTYHPAEAGNHTATVTISSDGADNCTVSLEGTAQPSAPVVVFNDEVSADKFKSVWESSSNAGLKDWHAISGAYHRDIAYGNGKLYVVHTNSYTATTVSVLDAYTGVNKTDLKVSGVTANALFKLASLFYFDGKFIGCNIGAGQWQQFTIYKWDNDDADATVIKQEAAKTTIDNTATALGASLYATGTWANGKIWLATNGATTIRVYPVTNGTVGDAQPITLKDAKGAARAYKSADGRGSAGIFVEADGTFWLNNMNGAPIHYKADGTYIEAMNKDAVGASVGGTGISVASFGSKRYLASTTYTTGSTNGQLALVNVTDGIAKAAAPVAVVPAAGLGADANAQRQSRVLLATDRKDGHTLDAWVSVPLQGIAHYSYDGDTTVGVSDIAVDGEADEAPVEYYNLSGVRVSGDYLAPGIYIRRQGKTVSKILIK